MLKGEQLETFYFFNHGDVLFGGIRSRMGRAYEKLVGNRNSVLLHITLYLLDANSDNDSIPIINLFEHARVFLICWRSVSIWHRPTKFQIPV